MPELRRGLTFALALAAVAGPAAAQLPPPLALPPPAAVDQPPPAASAPEAPPTPVTPAPIAVQAAPLQPPDLFSAEGPKPAGLPPDLWKGASLDIARTVIPMLSVRPLTPAAAAVARRMMSAGAAAPQGGGQDPELAAARIGAVLALGDAAGAHAMLEHTAGVRQSAALSQVAAEADLVLGRDDEACSLGDSLAVGKDAPYWRRLRVFCLVRAGDKPGAQLAYDLTTEQAKDETYKRLMSAAVSGSPPGAASLRNGLEYALVRRLQLDVTPALDKAWPPIVTAIAGDAAAPAPAQAAAGALIGQRQPDLTRAASLNPVVAGAVQALSQDKLDPAVSEALAADGLQGGMGSATGLALYTAAGGPSSHATRSALARFDIGRSALSQARLADMDAAAASGDKGDAALLALWLMADAGATGPTPADRARIAQALARAGFGEDARGYAIEGLLGLPTPIAAPPKAAPPPVRAKPAPKPARGRHRRKS